MPSLGITKSPNSKPSNETKTASLIHESLPVCTTVYNKRSSVENPNARAIRPPPKSWCLHLQLHLEPTVQLILMADAQEPSRRSAGGRICCKERGGLYPKWLQCPHLLRLQSLRPLSCPRRARTCMQAWLCSLRLQTVGGLGGRGYHALELSYTHLL